MSKKIYLYNTASRQKEELRPISENKIGIYSCGPTIYWNQHIGNMYAYVVWDALVRFLRYDGFEVKWVMNMTDVGHMTSDEDSGEDKMEKGARREGLTPLELAKKYEAQFLKSLELLNIDRPDHLPRATEHIEEQIKLAKKMEDRGFTYKTKTGLVFDTSKFPEYGRLANLKLDKMEAGARVEVDPDKRRPWDFLLWVTNQPNHIMKWDSPWGEGFPGWHLECTAMSTKYLGERFDIHTGGIEHIGVHHTNEVAQAYGAFGDKTANMWLHNAWLTLKDAKMSKSEGRVYTIEQLGEMGYNPLAFRYLVLTSHYRKGLVFSFESLEAAGKALDRLRNFVVEWSGGETGKISLKYKNQFKEAVADDLALPEGMAVLWKMVKDTGLSSGDKLATLLDFDRVLGLNLNRPVDKLLVPKEVAALVSERNKARESKDWRRADELRKKITESGYVVEDVEGESVIRKIK